ncbi:hypothetical protein PHISP_03548 [Aspergillus sp. HF37]|nr:hypothetical protein PHISP_03548 [Aspergillus sp. HF37]
MRQAIKSLASPESSHGRESLFKDATVVEGQLHQNPRSNTFAAAYADSSRPVLLDRTNYPLETPIDRVKPYARDLARLLRDVDPMGFGLLKCEGVIEWHGQDDQTSTQFQFIFGIPEGLSATPTTLRDLLIKGSRYPLSQRVQLAKQLARSVMFVHTAGFVTRISGRRPSSSSRKRMETAIAQSANPSSLDSSGSEQPMHQRTATGTWNDRRISTVIHLGVCLLEVGLWCSFVCEDGGCIVPWHELDISTALSDKDRRRGAFAIKKLLVELAKDRLPSVVGERYTSLAVSCLTCLDKDDNNAFGSPEELRDKDGIVVGVRYIEKILLGVEDITV